jgi:hypothetical protein
MPKRKTVLLGPTEQNDMHVIAIPVPESKRLTSTKRIAAVGDETLLALCAGLPDTLYRTYMNLSTHVASAAPQGILTIFDESTLDQLRVDPDVMLRRKVVGFIRSFVHDSVSPTNIHFAGENASPASPDAKRKKTLATVLSKQGMAQLRDAAASMLFQTSDQLRQDPTPVLCANGEALGQIVDMISSHARFEEWATAAISSYSGAIHYVPTDHPSYERLYSHAARVNPRSIVHGYTAINAKACKSRLLWSAFGREHTDAHRVVFFVTLTEASVFYEARERNECDAAVVVAYAARSRHAIHTKGSVGIPINRRYINMDAIKSFGAPGTREDWGDLNSRAGEVLTRTETKTHREVFRIIPDAIGDWTATAATGPNEFHKQPLQEGTQVTFMEQALVDFGQPGDGVWPVDRHERFAKHAFQLMCYLSHRRRFERAIKTEDDKLTEQIRKEFSPLASSAVQAVVELGLSTVRICGTALASSSALDSLTQLLVGVIESHYIDRPNHMEMDVGETPDTFVVECIADNELKHRCPMAGLFLYTRNLKMVGTFPFEAIRIYQSTAQARELVSQMDAIYSAKGSEVDKRATDEADWLYANFLESSLPVSQAHSRARAFVKEYSHLQDFVRISPRRSTGTTAGEHRRAAVIRMSLEQATFQTRPGYQAYKQTPLSGVETELGILASHLHELMDTPVRDHATRLLTQTIAKSCVFEVNCASIDKNILLDAIGPASDWVSPPPPTIWRVADHTVKQPPGYMLPQITSWPSVSADLVFSKYIERRLDKHPLLKYTYASALEAFRLAAKSIKVCMLGGSEIIDERKVDPLRLLLHHTVLGQTSIAARDAGGPLLISESNLNGRKPTMLEQLVLEDLEISASSENDTDVKRLHPPSLVRHSDRVGSWEINAMTVDGW